MVDVDFPALTGFYKFLFLYLEPSQFQLSLRSLHLLTDHLEVSTMIPAAMILTFPGAAWFYHELIPTPTSEPLQSLDARSKLAVWQLGNCYLLLGMISTVVFRTIRNAVPKDPQLQERLVGSLLFCLAVADLSHIFTSFLGIGDGLRYSPAAWNATTHGNITFTMFLFLVRASWFLGVRRQRFYYGGLGNNTNKKQI
ncbi:uncharacterized protein BT62DRAFT_1072790 [Guyanagaster necrorhizus]|uniref:DUF7704 domain-containing protein n=1 Tax=Guyanagaster necrorhizus TaxID=856835 RepID=A0A9P7W2G6_9AGAR|nr:uncharacterized protein BT62DRAFT_1072790 [Guyanagaster necrorhizus MCA 3950]KAG7450765.1 hypothetical protein BT62DRAFT_1072790 [Guyanagaster necrorhizus MCA 3950]